MYFHCAVLLHFRPFLSLRIANSPISPRAMCEEASRNISSLAKVYRSLYGLRRTPVFIPYLLLTAELAKMMDRRHWPEGNDSIPDPYPGENINYLTALTQSHLFAKRAISICNFFRHQWGFGTVHHLDRPAQLEAGENKIDDEVGLAWPHSLTFFRPDSDLERLHEGVPRSYSQQGLSITGRGLSLFSLQGDPLRKILPSIPRSINDQSYFERSRKGLEACGFEEN